jgi:O-methyltransferase involved in polyketide biosynthesis
VEKINPRNLIEQNPIFESLFAPLYFKAKETLQAEPIVVDTRSVEILELLDCDFSYFEKNTSGQFLISVRTKILDEQVANFIKNSANPIIINLGSGLDTRYARMQTGKIKCWYDLDLPEVIDFKKIFFKDTDCYRSIRKSVLDFSWIDEVQKDPANTYLFIAEGLLMYFSEDEIKELLVRLISHFPGSEMLCEVFHSKLVNFNVQNEEKNKDISFKWGVSDTQELKMLDPRIEIENEWKMFDYHQNRQKLFVRLLCKVSPRSKDLVKVLKLKFGEISTHA